jgi:8-oxo-dGTP pyrophosphatase MutT (NUDIX family)
VSADRVDALRRAIASHRAADAREEAACAHVRAALDRLARPFDEEADPEHITASAIVVGARGTVLHLHKRLGIWLQPGGHLATGEPPEQAARREAYEETGLTVAHPAGGPILIHVDVHAGARQHVHLDLRYLLLAPDDDPAPAPGESPQVAWFSWEDALAMADVALVGALLAARAPSAHARPPRGGYTVGAGNRHNGVTRTVTDSP